MIAPPHSNRENNTRATLQESFTDGGQKKEKKNHYLRAINVTTNRSYDDEHTRTFRVREKQTGLLIYIPYSFARVITAVLKNIYMCLEA